MFQLVRSVFAQGYTASWHALDIACNETPDRPATRGNDDGFAAWSPGEAMLADWSHLPFEWMEGDDDAACFAALRALPRPEKEKLFAAAVARTVKGQLAFEHGARPELEATVARLDIDFANHVRPTADMLWARIRKDRILEVARATLGPAWASARSKYKKADLAKAMEDAFATGDPPAGLNATAHAAALAWTMPGFAAFDAGRASEPDAGTEPSDADEAADTSDTKAGPEAGGKPRVTSVVESIDSPAVAERLAAARAAQEPYGGETPEGPAGGNGRDATVHVEAESRPGAADGDGVSENDPATDGEPGVTVQQAGAVNGQAAGGGLTEIPEFLRRV